MPRCSSGVPNENIKRGDSASGGGGKLPVLALKRAADVRARHSDALAAGKCRIALRVCSDLAFAASPDAEARELCAQVR